MVLLDRRRREGSEECGEGERQRGGKEGHRQRKHENRPGAGRARQDRASRRRGWGAGGVGDASLSRGPNVGKTQKTMFGSVTACNRVRTAGRRRETRGAYQQEITARRPNTDKTRDRVGGDGPDAASTEVSTHLNRSRLQQTAAFVQMSRVQSDSQDPD